MELAKEAMNLCNQLSERRVALEIAQRENHWRGIDHSVMIARLEKLRQRAADRWRRRMGYAPIYKSS